LTGPKLGQIEVSDKTRQNLEKLTTRHQIGQQKAQGARIILKPPRAGCLAEPVPNLVQHSGS
jgi:hypothetical protein